MELALVVVVVVQDSACQLLRWFSHMIRVVATHWPSSCCAPEVLALHRLRLEELMVEPVQPI